MEKKKVERRFWDYITFDYLTLDEAKAKIKKWKSETSGKENVRFKMVPKEYEEGHELVIVYDELETDEEYAKRIKYEEKWVENERRQYEQLKAKYESQVRKE